VPFFATVNSNFPATSEMPAFTRLLSVACNNDMVTAARALLLLSATDPAILIWDCAKEPVEKNDSIPITTIVKFFIFVLCFFVIRRKAPKKCYSIIYLIG
jgi:hypothetical protein